MRSDREKFLDIMEAMNRIERYVFFGKERFETDELVQTWFIQNLPIIFQNYSITWITLKICLDDLPLITVSQFRSAKNCSGASVSTTSTPHSLS